MKKNKTEKQIASETIEMMQQAGLSPDEMLEVIASAREKYRKIAETDMWQLLNKINTIMWESYMIKDRKFDREDGLKIMEVLNIWAKRY